VAMPAQVFIQNFGIHFIGARVPALGARLRPASASEWDEA
jgi:hypothetical protein